MGLEIRGVTGRLLSGGRTVASLWTWEARDLPGHRRLAVRVAHTHRDAYWWEHHAQPLVAELDVGNRVWRGQARIGLGAEGGPNGPLDLEVEGFDVV